MFNEQWNWNARCNWLNLSEWYTYRMYHMYLYIISYTIKFHIFIFLVYFLWKVIYWFSNLFIFCLFLEAHRALELLEDYHAKLTRPQDKQLRLAIERVIRIFKSRLFQALLGKSDHYNVFANFYTFEIIRIEILMAVSKISLLIKCEQWSCNLRNTSV